MTDAIERLQRAREAASSVSLSHRDGCVCVVCKAALGDEGALAEVVDALLQPRAQWPAHVHRHCDDPEDGYLDPLVPPSQEEI